MLSIKEFKELYEEMRGENIVEETIDMEYLESLQSNMIEYLRMKLQEASIIFKKFNIEGIYEVKYSFILVL